MNIALVHDFITSYTGAERVLKVLSDMYPNAPIFTLLYDPIRMGSVFTPARVQTSSLQRYPDWVRSRRRYLLGSFPSAIESFDLSSFDIVISSSGAWSKGVITKPSTKHICYCHAPMRYAWDWHSEYMAEHHLTGFKKFLALRMLNKARVWDYISSTRPDVWIANSNITRQRLQKYYHVDAQVIYPPVETVRFMHAKPSKIGMKPGSFYLIVSRLEPYKKIDIALDAFKTLPHEQLVIIGEGSAADSLRARAGHNIHFLGYQPDEIVTEYLQASKGFIFPGEDDFGIAPVEATASGKPVIAFARGGACETVRDGTTGILFPEANPLSLADALKRAATISWNPAALQSHAAQFDRAHFIASMQRVITKVGV